MRIRELNDLPAQITELIKTESDRGVILILATYLEEILGALLTEACVSDKAAGSILELRQAAGDFDSKIRLSLAFGFIHDEEAKALRIVQRIRNKAAHFDHSNRGFNVLFDSPTTIDQVVALADIVDTPVNRQEKPDIRNHFISSARTLATLLMLRAAFVNKPNPCIPMVDILDKSAEYLKETELGKIGEAIKMYNRSGNNKAALEAFDEYTKLALTLLPAGTKAEDIKTLIDEVRSRHEAYLLEGNSSG
jgi:hypothetical protein